MTDFPCPTWLQQRGISDEEYAVWLQGQSKDIWKRERSKGKTACTTRAELKSELHRVALKSTGYDPYSNIRFNVDPLRSGWTDAQAYLNNSRHHRTLRRSVPSFDHVRGLGRRSYELCTRETNSAKTYMSPAQFIELCHRVAKHRPSADPPIPSNSD